MNKAVQIYDIANDNLRPIAQEDVDLLVARSNDAAIIKRILQAISRPINPQTDGTKYRAMLERLHKAIAEP